MWLMPSLTVHAWFLHVIDDFKVGVLPIGVDPSQPAAGVISTLIELVTVHGARLSIVWTVARGSTPMLWTNHAEHRRCSEGTS